MEIIDLLGRVVYSRAGRDKEKYYIITSILNENYVYISDGRLRKINKPKKKKLKHIIITEKFSVEIRDLILNKEYLSNSKIYNFLEFDENTNKEV
ncbi:MAG: RNA-binding protein [Clostridium sp.]